VISAGFVLPLAEMARQKARVSYWETQRKRELQRVMP
jgi:hypothetical protein